MKYIISNIFPLLLRILLLNLFLFMYTWPTEKLISGDYKTNETAFFLGLLVYSMFPVYLMFSLRNPIFIKLPNVKRFLVLFYFFNVKIIKLEEIKGYYKTTISIRMGNYDGIIIILRKERKIKLSVFDLKKYSKNQICVT